MSFGCSTVSGCAMEPRPQVAGKWSGGCWPMLATPESTSWCLDLSSQLSNERQQRTLGGGFHFRGALLGGYRRERNDVTVSLLVRVIDAKTGEVKLSTVGEGRGRRVARSIGGLGLIGKPIAAAFANKA